MVSSPSVVDPRNSRYRTTSCPPPGLRKVLKALGKDVRRRGRGELVGVTKDEVRVIAKVAEREYDIHGRADDLVRFLENTAVLVSDPKDHDLFYFDQTRGAYVEACCRDRSMPLATKAPPDRIVELREEARLAMQSREEESEPFPLPPPAASPAPDEEPYAVPTHGEIMSVRAEDLRPLLDRLLTEEAEALERAERESARAARAGEAAKRVQQRIEEERAAVLAEAQAKKAQADRLLVEADAVQREADDLLKKAAGI